MPTLAVGLLYEEQQNLIHYQSPVCVCSLPDTNFKCIYTKKHLTPAESQYVKSVMIKTAGS